MCCVIHASAVLLVAAAVQEENMVSSAEMRSKYASVEEAEDDFM
jgi:hypothetical protein